jgi:hypothetical protein
VERLNSFGAVTVSGCGNGEGRDTGIFGFLLCRRIEGGRRFVDGGGVCGVHGVLSVSGAMVLS